MTRYKPSARPRNPPPGPDSVRATTSRLASPRAGRPKGSTPSRRFFCEAGHAANGPLDVKCKALLVRRGRKLSIFALLHKRLRSVFVMIDQGGHYRDARVDYETVGVERSAPRWMKMLRKYEYIPA